ncbi:MAG TPA: protein-methionine-sulfoxide reductase heme-binding subunit MsrQ [Candidatus Eisenbacteria bacterium]|nr:protein-methionine-sulfoxide reductase heme-binding subunit MsrQ [Candidatus Eisenbacteria bacterium]
MFHYIKIIAFTACLVPLGQLIYNAATNNLGANPIEAITRFTGSWALIFILVTLGVTPVRKTTGWNDLVKLRRMLGLFAFFYASLHFATYFALDHFFDFATIAKDVVKRPYVTAGFTAFVLMVPLAITSTKAMIRRLGRRWQQLHYLVYVVAVAGVLHFYWLVKADTRRPVLYGSVLAVLLGCRVVSKWSPALALRRKGPAGLAR